MNWNSCSSSGKSAIGGWIRLAFLCLHLIHLNLIFRNAFVSPLIQYSCLSMFLTYSVPSCRLSLCALSNRNCTTGCFAVNKIGCLELQSKFECCSRPSTQFVPSSSMNGDSFAIFNVFEISLLFNIDFGFEIREAFGLNQSKQYLLCWWISSVFRGPSFFVWNLIQ